MEDIIFLFSYCMNVGYLPEKYIRLTKAIIIFHEKGIEHKDKELTRQLINLFVKLGFMLLARDIIDRINGKNTRPDIRIHIEYNLYNFIYYSKAVLDSIATTINYAYNLGLRDGNIDLNKSVFLKRLGETHIKLSVLPEINCKMNWISNVVEWRKQLIHRCVTTVAHYGDPDKTMDYSIKMSQEPIPILDYIRMDELKRRHKMPPLREIVPFCDGWISNAKWLIEKLGDDLLEKYGGNS